MSDDLSAPLGKRRKSPKFPRRRGKRHLPLARLGIGIIALVLAGSLGWILAVDDPTGGLPRADAPVGDAPPPNTLAEDVRSQPAPASQSGQTGGERTGPSAPNIITFDDDGPADPGGSVDADPSQGAGAAARAITQFGAEPTLVEETEYGPIPRVSAEGERPFDAYAQEQGAGAAAQGPRVAIVVTGLGLNGTTTREAIQSLPGAVTLAFAPYGNDLPDLARDARSDGHELLLELPLEPFDYPQNDPGPHTLLAEQPPRDNLDKLYWLMARFGGYVGTINNLGARFSASAADFAPIMEELGLRGLAYIDDGSSNRSVAPQLSRQNDVPFARSDIELDETLSRAAIEDHFARLEARARERGSAVAIISALPVSMEVLGEWARQVEESDIRLVPISALTPDPLEEQG